MSASCRQHHIQNGERDHCLKTYDVYAGNFLLWGHSMNQRSQSISFRVSPTIARDLQTKARERGQTPGKYARELVLDSLSSKDRVEILHDLEDLRNQVRRLREDLATAVIALLTREGPVTIDDAKSWVKNELLR